MPLCSWYHGKISRDGAERCLKDVSFDCFLVRESEKRPGEYSLSLKHKTVVKHFRVDVKRGSTIRYELFGAQKSFPSLSDLIDYYTRHCITTAGETLTAPCPSEVRQGSTPQLSFDMSTCRAPVTTRPHPSLLQGERICRVFDVKNLPLQRENNSAHDHVKQRTTSVTLCHIKIVLCNCRPSSTTGENSYWTRDTPTECCTHL